MECQLNLNTRTSKTSFHYRSDLHVVCSEQFLMHFIKRHIKIEILLGQLTRLDSVELDERHLTPISLHMSPRDN